MSSTKTSPDAATTVPTGGEIEHAEGTLTRFPPEAGDDEVRWACRSAWSCRRESSRRRAASAPCRAILRASQPSGWQPASGSASAPTLFMKADKTAPSVVNAARVMKEPASDGNETLRDGVHGRRIPARHARGSARRQPSPPPDGRSPRKPRPDRRGPNETQASKAATATMSCRQRPQMNRVMVGDENGEEDTLVLGHGRRNMGWETWEEKPGTGNPDPGKHETAPGLDERDCWCCRANVARRHPFGKRIALLARKHRDAHIW